MIDKSFWRDRSVFVTGHTGFKGGWISLWLSKLGAKVHGYSLVPPTAPNFFSTTQLESWIQSSTIADIRDLTKLTSALQAASPSIVIHMAAQALVRESYVSPVETFATNALGTVNLLEAVRIIGTIEAVVNVTTDKCYENKEWVWPYRENDSLGGQDPYSASKACMELITRSYRDSCFSEREVQLASARAGNVIGGGDWATDRVIPDFLRAIDTGETLSIRSPSAVRPWQHVLGPLSGYLLLAERLVTEGAEFAEAWNFGSEEADSKPVSWILDRLCHKIPSANWVLDRSPQPHEASVLKLDSVKAKTRLHWAPQWSLETALDKTLEWHQAWRDGRSMADISIQQIEEYQSL